MNRLWGLWLAVTLCVVGYGGLVAVDQVRGTLRAGTTPLTIGLYGWCFAGFLVAAWWNERAAIPAPWFWAVPVAARVALWFTEPTLSDDVYRYLWDGHLLTQGVNPYSYAISAPQLDSFEIAARTLANNPELASPYLPVAQLVFAAVVLLGPDTATTMQIVMTGFDLATAAVLYRLLPMAGLPAGRVLLYLWNPLVIVELAHGAHLDALMVFLATLALWAGLRTGRAAGADSPAERVDGGRSTSQRLPSLLVSPVALACSVLTRPVPMVLAPVLWWRWTGTQRAAFALTGLGLLLPFGFGRSGWGLSGSGFGVGVFGSARVYSDEFRFNAVISTWLERAFGGSAPALSLVTGAVMALVGLVVWLRARHHRGSEVEQIRSILRLAVIPVMAYVLLTPVLHPWYLVILMVLLPFLTPAVQEDRLRWVLLAPWAYLAASLPLSYLTYRDPDAFGELDWVRRVEWFPTIALVVVALSVASRQPNPDEKNPPPRPA